MNAEKEIVEAWLNSLGFFTIKNINAGKSVIDLIGIKSNGGIVQKIVHVEVACSISNEILVSDCIKKFNDSKVKSKIKGIIRNFVGKDLNYENVLVTTSKKRIRSIEIIDFADILKKVIENLDKQRYDNQTIRTLQIMKFIYLKRNKVYRSISKKKKREILIESLNDYSMIRTLLKSPVIKSVVNKYLRRNKDFLINYLQSLNKKKREEIFKKCGSEKEKIKERKETNISLKNFLK